MCCEGLGKYRDATGVGLDRKDGMLSREVDVDPMLHGQIPENKTLFCQEKDFSAMYGEAPLHHLH